jgi:hypothetical protein
LKQAGSPLAESGSQPDLLLLQQWRDEGAFFGQKRFGYEQERIIPGTFFIPVYRQNCGAHC